MAGLTQFSVQIRRLFTSFTRAIMYFDGCVRCVCVFFSSSVHSFLWFRVRLRFILSVFFFSRFFFSQTVPPSVKAVNHVVGAPVGSHVLLECIVEVFPKPLNGWYRNDGKQHRLCRLIFLILFIQLLSLVCVFFSLRSFFCIRLTSFDLY